jgi:hypothetical protein
MKAWTKRVLQVAICTMLAYSLTAVGDDDDVDDKAVTSDQQKSAPSLSSE